MDIIVPTTITDALLDTTNVAEADYAEYAAGTTYGDGDTVIITTAGVHKIYESLKAENVGNYPPDNLTGVDPWWLYIGYTNRWKCLDGIWGTQTSNANSITYQLTPGAINSCACLNMDADILSIIQRTPGATIVVNGDFTTNTADWSAYNSATLTSIAGGQSGNCLHVQVAELSVYGGAYQTLTTVAETNYNVKVFVKTPYPPITFTVSIGSTGAGSSDLATITGLAPSAAWTEYNVFFTAANTTTTITLEGIGVAEAVGGQVDFDTVSVHPLTQIYTSTTALGAENPVTQITDVAKIDLVSNADAILYISLSYSGGTAKLGMLIVGTSQNLGSTLEKPGISFTDYSVWTDDGNGNFTITAGAYAKKMNAVVSIANTSVDGIARALAYYRATAVVYVADDSYSSLIIYGFMKAFDLVFTTKDYSIYSCRVEGKI